VRKTHFTALAALHKVGGGQGVLGAPAFAAAFGKFSLWMWNHITPVTFARKLA